MGVEAQAELAGDEVAGEIAFADEERCDEDARRGKHREDPLDLRFLFPERLADFGEKVTAAQFRRVLTDRRGGIGVLLRAVTQHHERGIGEFVAVHAKGLAQEQAIRKLALQKKIFD